MRTRPSLTSTSAVDGPTPGLERLVLGCVADKGARGSETPVLVTPVLAP